MNTEQVKLQTKRAHKLFTGAADKMLKKGADPHAVAASLMSAAMQLAIGIHDGDREPVVLWLRTLADEVERGASKAESPVSIN